MHWKRGWKRLWQRDYRISSKMKWNQLFLFHFTLILWIIDLFWLWHVSIAYFPINKGRRKYLICYAFIKTENEIRHQISPECCWGLLRILQASSNVKKKFEKWENFKRIHNFSLEFSMIFWSISTALFYTSTALEVESAF